MHKRKRNSSHKNKSMFRFIWLILGILILIWNIFWFVKVKIRHEYGMVRDVIRYDLGIFILVTYILIEIILLLIRKFKEHKSLK